jgi:hypothetical protein
MATRDDQHSGHLVDDETDRAGALGILASVAQPDAGPQLFLEPRDEQTDGAAQPIRNQDDEHDAKARDHAATPSSRASSR